MKSDWDEVGEWYGSLVGEEGHFYHQNVIWPRLLPLLDLKAGDSLLDLGCGEGVLSSQIPKEVRYSGVDLAPTLIQRAKKERRGHFLLADMCAPLPSLNLFTHVTALLCLQNVPNPSAAIHNAAKHLR